MRSRIMLCLFALLGPTATMGGESITGLYLEARTCDVWTGPCFANADMNLIGKNAILAWKINRGAIQGISLDGLGVAAVVSASDTLGMVQTGPARAVLIVDNRANEVQKAALLRFAQQQGGELVRHVVGVQQAEFDLALDCCGDGGCARLRAGAARIETRCLDSKHDKACGNERAYYPPLAASVKATPAVAAEHHFAGTGLDETWSESGRRGAYVGTFEIR